MNSALDAIPSCIDQVATRFADDPSEGEIQRAREEYDTRRGRVYDDDELYEGHMASFLEWYVLERRAAGATPAELALRGADPPQEPLLRALATSQRSLFEVQQQRPQGLLLEDLIRGGRWQVDLERPMAGLQRSDIFEARLVPWEGRVMFGPAFCYHPGSARRQIRGLLTEARQQGRLGPARICELAEMRLRFSRFRNIAVDHIYTHNTRMKGERRDL